jgi:hypothetical protein
MVRNTRGLTGSLGAAGRPTKAGQLFVCAECRCAQPFAVQPRAVCTRPGAPLEGAVLFAGQPACAQFAPRKSAEPVLSSCSPDLEQARRRSARTATSERTRDL